MELKQERTIQEMLRQNLLIVPYGIETHDIRYFACGEYAFNRTLWNWNLWIVHLILNLNSFNRTLWNWNVCWRSYPICLQLLLIVPYGIETSDGVTIGNETKSFNRTLWNWNDSLICCSKLRQALLIVPYGIETLIWLHILSTHQIF